jgi:hypothetical protein
VTPSEKLEEIELILDECLATNLQKDFIYSMVQDQFPKFFTMRMQGKTRALQMLVELDKRDLI